MIKCIVCSKIEKNKINKPINYTFISIDKLCNICKEKKINQIIKYEHYRYSSCQGGC